MPHPRPLGWHLGRSGWVAGWGQLHDHGMVAGSVMVEGAGHWVQQERPEQVNAALLEFLGGL